MKKLSYETILHEVTALNELLGQPIPQSAKARIASTIESLLMELDLYAGYNNLYWFDQGYKEWYDNGQPDFPEKERYICGPEGALDRSHRSDFVSARQGEFARNYYLGRLRDAVKEVKCKQRGE